MRPAAELAERLGLDVTDLDLLEQALVHSSWLHEHRDAARGHNERLEFLGDVVINLAISEALYAAYPADDEGLLSTRRASIVRTAPQYPVGALAPMDRALLRSAIGEVLHSPTPARVAIAEWVELARTYSGDPMRRLMNGVLGRIASTVGR